MDEREVRRAFHAAFDGTRPGAGAADRAFAAVAAGGAGTYGVGRRLAGAAAVALAILVVVTLLIARGALVPRHATVPAARPVATPTPSAPPVPIDWAPGLPNEPQPPLVAAQSDQVVLAGWPDSGQLALTTDGGATWAALHVPAGHILDLQFVDADTALVSTDAGLFRFQRSAVAWTRLSPRTDLAHLDFRDRSSGYALTAAGDAVETQDGGRTLILVDVGLHPVTWIQWVSGTHAWAAGPQGIAATADGGASWARQLSFPVGAGPPGPVAWAQVGFRDVVNGFALVTYLTAGVPDSIVYHTGDGGATWTAESCTCHTSTPAGLGDGVAPLPEPYSELVVTGGSSAMLVTYDPVRAVVPLCATADAGRDWSCGSAPFDTGPAALAVRDQTRWLVVAGGQLAASQDAGTTWSVRGS